jgi:hypothetical protein
MGRFFAPGAFFALLLAGAVQAQQPYAVDPCAATSLQPPCCGCPCPQPAPPPGCPSGGAWDREALFALELIAGQETGVRGQFALFRDANEAFVAEGFYGYLFHHLGSAQTLGAGGRYLIQTSWPDCVDSLLIGPGVDVFFQLNHNSLLLLTPSLDVAWLHALGNHFVWELGLDVGLGIGVSGHTNHGSNAVGDVVPLISIYTGLRF